MSMIGNIANEVLTWYRQQGRDLPWRHSDDPYEIWISEVMLQQTRVETVVPYFEEWMRIFPSIHALASASIDDVLRIWEGLGYYRRAHNLHKSAQIIVTEYDGILPDDFDRLLTLPGIGPYIAAAISVFAFHKDMLALDGNLKRVIARLIDLPLPPSSREGEMQIRAWAAEVIPPDRASDFNQGLMDIGAALCLPKNPDCGSCPLQKSCLAYQNGNTMSRPVRILRDRPPQHTASAAILRNQDRVLIGRRPPDKLLGGLWEFPGGKLEEGETLEACLLREIQEELGVEIEVREEVIAVYHAYSHFSICVHAFECEIKSGEPSNLDHTEIAWVPVEHLGDYPMGKVDRQISRELQDRME